MARLGRRFWLVAVPVAGIVIAIGAIVVWMSSGNQASLSNGIANSKKVVPSVPQDLTNQYFSLTYPGTYHVTADATQPPDLANYILMADTAYTKQLSVTLSSGTLDSTSAYIFRRTRNDVYSSQPVTVAGEAASLWTKSDGTEQTVFVPHNGMVLTLSFSIQNSNATEGLSAEVTNLLATIKWRS